MIPELCAACGLAPGERPCQQCGSDPLLRGRYVLHAVVGQGASGTTYRARDLETDRVVAIKEMPLHRAETRKATELLGREADVLRQLDHPAIPDYIDHFLEGKGKHRSYFLVQSFIEGMTLGAEMRDRRYAPAEVLEIAEAILRILVYLHGLAPPVVHRDIKPQNLMRSTGGRLVLLDFGSVRDVLRDVDFGGSTVAGTFGYMAPEQFAGDASPRSDLYGVGATMVALLSRKDPSTMQRPHTLELDWRRHVAVSGQVRAYMDKLLALEPEERFDSAESAIRALAYARAPDPPVPERPPPSFDRQSMRTKTAVRDDTDPIPRRPPQGPMRMAAPKNGGGIGWVFGFGFFASLAGMLVAAFDHPDPASSHGGVRNTTWIVTATVESIVPPELVMDTLPSEGDLCTIRGTARGEALPHRIEVACAQWTLSRDMSCAPTAKGALCQSEGQPILAIDQSAKTIVVGAPDLPHRIHLRY
jgi:serine/threonine protein kinase